jgi:hypothetical protein
LKINISVLKFTRCLNEWKSNTSSIHLICVLLDFVTVVGRASHLHEDDRRFSIQTILLTLLGCSGRQSHQKITFTFHVLPFFLSLQYKFIIHWTSSVVFFSSFILIFDTFRLFFPFLYSVVHSDFFCVVNYLFHTFFAVDPLFLSHVHVQFILWSSVSLHSHSMWSTDR